MKTTKKYINEAVPIERNLKSFFNKDQKLIIFDIGSCEGLDSIRYSELFPHSKIYSFEPIESNFKKILDNLRKFSCKNVSPYRIALSVEKGSAEFYVSSGHPENLSDSEDWDYGNKCSSLLEPDKIKVVHPWLNFKQKIKVQTDTLKNFCIDTNILDIDFIHMDVQGAELIVLKGAKSMLSKIKLIWMEVESVTYYKNQPLKKDVENFMANNGFFKIKSTVGKNAGDQLYVNKTFFKEKKGKFLYYFINVKMFFNSELIFISKAINFLRCKTKSVIYKFKQSI